MTIPRIYHPNTIGNQTQLQLTENASRHVISVLRLKEDNNIIVFDGHNIEYHTVIIQPHKRHTVVKIIDKTIVDRESSLSITLVQSLARGDKMDFIIQKAVELGVTQFVPVFTEFSNVKLSAERAQKRLQHWQGVIISASEQCGRNRLMQITMPVKLSQYLQSLSTLNKDTWRLLLSPDGLQQLRDQLLQLPTPQNIMLIVGCEGGLSPAECQLAEQHSFTPINLGKRILRTETAALAVVSALQLYYNDGRK